MKKITLHVCCGVCAGETINRLKRNFEEAILYFYNPNIEPFEEYRKRLEAAKKIAGLKGIKLAEGEYENNEWRNYIKGYEKEPEGGKRCDLCFKMRLEKTALFAKKNNCAIFATTLTMGPRKNAESINKIGREAADKYELKFLEEDFKKQKGFEKAIVLAKEHNLYRQNYCGCLFSPPVVATALQADKNRY